MASVSFIDIIAARAAIRSGGASDQVRRLLMDLDSGKEETPFLASLSHRDILTDDQIERTKGLARQYFFMRNETAYLHYLNQLPSIDGQRVAQLRDGQAKAGYRDRIGVLLVRENLIDEAADKTVGDRARNALKRENQKQLDHFRSLHFKGLETLGQTGRQPRASTESDQEASQAPTSPNPTAKKTPPQPDSNLMISSIQALFGEGTKPPNNQIDTRPLQSLNSAENAKHGQTATGANKAAAGSDGDSDGCSDDEGTEDDNDLNNAAAIAASLGHPLEGTGLETRYRLKSKLGQGGMGAVYLAYDLEDEQKPVALKIALPDHQSEDGFGRFKREILCNSFLEHPNIVTVYDGGENANGTYFMAMEYVEGEPLSEKMKREGIPSVLHGLRIIEQVLEALVAAHTARIVHRDLKPENFLCFDIPGGGLGIKLMDFGIARILDDEQEFSNQFFQTNIGQITGSPAYVAPESITEPQIDERADLYTLGVILFEFCVGRLPFRGKDPTEYLGKHLYGPPPDPCEQAPHRGIITPLRDMILKLLAKRPSERYPSAQAVLDEIQSVIIPHYHRDQTQVMTGRVTRGRLNEALGQDDSQSGADLLDTGPTEVDIAKPPNLASSKEEGQRAGALQALADASAHTQTGATFGTASASLLQDARAESPQANSEQPSPKPLAPSVAKAKSKPRPAPQRTPTPPLENPAPKVGMLRRIWRKIFGG